MCRGTISASLQRDESCARLSTATRPPAVAIRTQSPAESAPTGVPDVGGASGAFMPACAALPLLAAAAICSLRCLPLSCLFRKALTRGCTGEWAGSTAQEARDARREEGVSLSDLMRWAMDLKDGMAQGDGAAGGTGAEWAGASGCVGACRVGKSAVGR